MGITGIGSLPFVSQIVLGQNAESQKPGIASPYFRALKFQLDTDVDNLFKITDNKSLVFEAAANKIANTINNLFKTYTLQPWMKTHLIMKLFEVGLNSPKTSRLMSEIRKQWSDIPKDSVGAIIISAEICKGLGLGDVAITLNAIPTVPPKSEDLGSYIQEWLFALCDIKASLTTKNRDAHVAARGSLVGVINKDGCKEKIVKLALDAILESLDVQWDDEAQINADRAVGLEISNKWIALPGKGDIPLSPGAKAALGTTEPALKNIPAIPKSEPVTAK